MYLHLQTKRGLIGAFHCDLSGDDVEDDIDKRTSDVADVISEFGNQRWREAAASQEIKNRKLQFLESKEAYKARYMQLSL
ncbi:hypothetical protein P3T76_008373 [Phytophthora citrophthora]|uniref:Uncharacterized protein n=1 Tax=Phytophthora citrophthora TaxID=4793 RepID=A0AAD9GK95_9STRA|nr:hypothetical protein P3T76_008373 [Phytophthora citrophthora]